MTITEAATGTAPARGVRTRDRGGWLGGGIVLLGLAALVTLGMTALGLSVVAFWGWDPDVLTLSAAWAVVPAALAAAGWACVRRATGQHRPGILTVLLAAWAGAWAVMNVVMGTVVAL